MGTDFGFSLNKSKQIDMDKADVALFRHICAAEPSLNTCIFCGTCAATCTASKHTEFSFRKISVYLRRGLVKEVKSEASRCMMCGKCIMACPRGVNTRNVMFHLNEAFHGNEF